MKKKVGRGKTMFSNDERAGTKRKFADRTFWGFFFFIFPLTFSSFIFENSFDFQLVWSHDCFKFNFNNPKNGFDSNRPSYRPVVRDSCRPVQRFVTTVMSYSSHWISLLATEHYAVSHTGKSLFSYFTTRRRAVLCQNAQESITRIARAHNALVRVCRT